MESHKTYVTVTHETPAIKINTIDCNRHCIVNGVIL